MKKSERLLKIPKVVVISTTLIVIVRQFFLFDFHDMSWSKNSENYTKIISMILFVIFTNLYFERKNKKIYKENEKLDNH